MRVILCHWTPEQTPLSATGEALFWCVLSSVTGPLSGRLYQLLVGPLFWCVLSSVTGPLSGRLYQPLVRTLIWGMFYFLSTSD